MLKKVLNIILDIIIIVVIILLIYIMIQKSITKENYTNIFGYTFLEVLTGSMSGTIEIGDGVIVKITKDVEEEDIIVYKKDNSLITHRLIEIDENGEFITKGDANNTEDKPVNETQVLGKVTYIIPKLGIWRKAILSPQVLILIASLIILLGIAFKITTNTEEKDE